MGWATTSMSKLKRNMLSVIGLCLVIVGIAALSWPAMQTKRTQQEGRNVNASSVAKVQKEVAQTAALDTQWESPVALELPRLGIALDILPGTYNARAQSWSLDKKHAYYMQPTDGFAPGTPVLYGHSIPGVLRGLEGAAQDELLKVHMADGSVLWFRYSGDKLVSPSDLHALQQKVDNAIFIMTCSGAHFEHRRVMQFDYIGQGSVS